MKIEKEVSFPKIKTIPLNSQIKCNTEVLRPTSQIIMKKLESVYIP
jgi:hypothetical protein